MLIFVQILRAVAAAMVVWHHARHEAGLLAACGAGETLSPDTVLPWWAGVDLFFVISGLVIVLASRPLVGLPGGRGHFLAHRIARVAPLYWLTTLLYLALALAVPSLLGEAGALVRDPAFVAASFLFWPLARPDGAVQPLYGLGWTLNYEMAFYALFALGLGFTLRGAVVWLCAVLVALVTAGTLVALPMPLAFWADPIVLEFALGALLGLARVSGLRLPPVLRIGLTLLGAAGFLLAARQLQDGAEVPGFARPLLVGLPALLLVAAAALGPSRDRAGITALPAPMRGLARLGDASYALYLTHPFALRAGREALLRLGLAPALHPWGAMLAMTGLALAVSLAVHAVVERPLTERLRSFLENRVGARRRPVFIGREDR